MKYGLIGERLGHSFSKPIHEKIGGYDYELKELKKEELSSFMLEREFECLNVTIPYKTVVIPYLSYIDPVAQRIGAVNTVVNRDGELYGYNTDFGGMKMLIEKQGFDYKNKKVLILGTGGTSKTAYAVAESLGASEIIKVSRSGEVNYENLYLLHKDADYIINTTPCGMYPDNFSCPVDIDEFNCLKGVTDAVYNPIKTMLCLKAHEKEIPAEGGLYMLVAQGVLACEYFTGKSLDVKAVTDDIYSELLCEKQNIVLIGMPGSGKSTIGKALSDKMQKGFTDTDTLITEAYGEISRIFSEKGEKYFRDIESEKVKLASKSSGKVIATGGGAILRKENVLALKQNGILFFLNRPLEDIVPTSDRPLSSDYENLKKRFIDRYGIYQTSADYEIHVDGVVGNAVADIMEKFI